MIEVDFDIEVLPKQRRITVTHRCYQEDAQDEKATRWEELIALNLESLVHRFLLKGLSKEIEELGYNLKLVSQNPDFGKK